MTLLLGAGLGLQAQAGRLLRVPQEYAGIQQAVEAAADAGDEIRVAAGTYEERVIIRGKQIVVSGEPGAILKASPDLIPEPTLGLLSVFTAYEGADVTVRNLTVDGAHLGQGEAGPFLVGIVLLDSSGLIEGCTIHGFRGANRLGSVWSSGTYVGAMRDEPRSHVVLRGNHYRDNGLSIYLAGNSDDPEGRLRLTFAVVDNVIEGIGPTSLDWQYGIFLAPGVSGVVRSNRIADHFGINPPGRWSSAIQMTWETFHPSHHPVRFEGNLITGNQQSLAVSRGDGVEIVNNVFEGRGRSVANHHGIILTGERAVVTGNVFRDLPKAVHLMNDNPFFGHGSGVATDTVLTLNRTCDTAQFLQSDTGVTRTANLAALACAGLVPTNFPVALSPSEGGAGDTVVITGAGLGTAREVVFHGTAAEFTSETNALGEVSLRVIVPARARSGPVTVVTERQLAISTNEFTRVLPVSVAREENGAVAVMWPEGFEDFELERSAGLGGGEWKGTVGSPTRVGAGFRKTVEKGGGAEFFRLRRGE